jgi:hypothetical protein
MAAISTLKLVASANKKRTVAAPQRKRNSEYRSREHLTELLGLTVPFGLLNAADEVIE